MYEKRFRDGITCVVVCTPCLAWTMPPALPVHNVIHFYNIVNHVTQCSYSTASQQTEHNEVPVQWSLEVLLNGLSCDALNGG